MLWKININSTIMENQRDLGWASKNFGPFMFNHGVNRISLAKCNSEEKEEVLNIFRGNNWVVNESPVDEDDPDIVEVTLPNPNA